MGKLIGDIDLVWIKSRTTENDNGCWIWTGARAGLGYGYFRLRSEGKNFYAHRTAFLIVHGHWPNVCRHTCDVYACCNPDHLLDGDHTDNMRDAIERGQMVHAKGEQHVHVLKERDVIEARTWRVEGGTFPEMAAYYGVAKSTIRSAVQGRSWKHLPGAVPANSKIN